jgi:outer membrane protein OmpA-like peptidoglycan-associated protein
MLRIVILLLCFAWRLPAQDTLLIQSGKKAPAFIMNLQQNTIQSVTFPNMNCIMLLQFWSSTSWYSRSVNSHLKRVARRYKNASYRNADNFEIIAIAVQSDREGWKQAIKDDSLYDFTNGIAPRGFSDAVCRKYGVTSVPASFLIDESGTILSVNPKPADIENILDERKNFVPIRKDLTGILAQSSNKNDVLKFSKVFLFNYYGDSLAKSMTNEKGEFFFGDVKLTQDIVLKVDNQIDITTSDPIALYSPEGDFMMDGFTKEAGFVFNITARNSTKLVKNDTTGSSENALGEIDVIKSLTFAAAGKSLTIQDEQDLKPILQRLLKNQQLKLEFVTHTDTKSDAEAALQLTARQADAIKTYFIKKGIPGARVKAIAKGNSDVRKRCDGTIDCREEDHRMNRRVEFLVYKD